MAVGLELDGMDMESTAPFHWVFHTPLPEQTGAFLELSAGLGEEFDARLSAAVRDAGVVLRAEFDGEAGEAEERGREFWLELHSRCLDRNLGLELVDADVPADAWQPLGSFLAAPPPLPVPSRPEATPDALSPLRPDIPAEPLYDLLLADDPDMDRNLRETIEWIESQGLPVINLLSYLDLPLFTAYAAEHADERDQNLFLHMLHTWSCYRRFGRISARLTPELAEAFTSPIYLRLNTTQFRSPAPALCIQFPDWQQLLRGPRPQWVKEIYLTHMEPPTPADDRELTLMIVAYDERGEYGFIPLEVPLSLPGVGQSIDAFFAPGEADEELGANSEDLHRLTAITATYCLYASAADPGRYLASGTPG